MSLAGGLGYAIAAVGFLLLTLVLAAGWQGRARGVRLIVASGATAAWAAWLAWLSTRDDVPLLAVFPAQTLRTGAWLLVLAQLAGTGGMSRIMVRFSHVAWPGVLAAGLVMALAAPALLNDVTAGGGVLLAVTGLVMLEQIYRNSNTSGRWGLRYLYIGLGGLLFYDVFLYSQALLLNGISQDAWFARGYVTALAVPFIAIAARRNPAWSLRVFVSRDVVFYTTSFMAVGAYLLLMAGGGYLVRLVGGSWGVVLQIVFFAAALGVLAILIGSSDLRRRLRVFLVKHFYRNKYDYREEWLRFIGTLSADSTDEAAAVTGIRAVAQIIDSPGAALMSPGDRAAGWRLEAT
ncbi:MAG TPA: PEP-CTERM system histidine kinase PrsK, partial [Gammaproteobacteria bacterium]